MLVCELSLESMEEACLSKAIVSYCRKDIHILLVNRLGCLPRNSVVRLTEHLHSDMAIVFNLDIKQKSKR